MEINVYSYFKMKTDLNPALINIILFKTIITNNSPY